MITVKYVSFKSYDVVCCQAGGLADCFLFLMKLLMLMSMLCIYDLNCGQNLGVSSSCRISGGP